MALDDVLKYQGTGGSAGDSGSTLDRIMSYPRADQPTESADDRKVRLLTELQSLRHNDTPEGKSRAALIYSVLKNEYQIPSPWEAAKGGSGQPLPTEYPGVVPWNPATPSVPVNLVLDAVNSRYKATKLPQGKMPPKAKAPVFSDPELYAVRAAEGKADGMAPPLPQNTTPVADFARSLLPGPSREKKLAAVMAAPLPYANSAEAQGLRAEYQKLVGLRATLTPKSAEWWSATDRLVRIADHLSSRRVTPKLEPILKGDEKKFSGRSLFPEAFGARRVPIRKDEEAVTRGAEAEVNADLWELPMAAASGGSLGIADQLYDYGPLTTEEAVKVQGLTSVLSSVLTMGMGAGAIGKIAAGARAEMAAGKALAQLSRVQRAAMLYEGMSPALRGAVDMGLFGAASQAVQQVRGVPAVVPGPDGKLITARVRPGMNAEDIARMAAIGGVSGKLNTVSSSRLGQIENPLLARAGGAVAGGVIGAGADIALTGHASETTGIFAGVGAIGGWSGAGAMNVALIRERIANGIAGMPEAAQANIKKALDSVEALGDKQPTNNEQRDVVDNLAIAVSSLPKDAPPVVAEVLVDALNTATRNYAISTAMDQARAEMPAPVVAAKPRVTITKKGKYAGQTFDVVGETMNGSVVVDIPVGEKTRRETFTKGQYERVAENVTTAPETALEAPQPARTVESATPAETARPAAPVAEIREEAPSPFSKYTDEALAAAARIGVEGARAELARRQAASSKVEEPAQEQPAPTAPVAVKAEPVKPAVEEPEIAKPWELAQESEVGGVPAVVNAIYDGPEGIQYVLHRARAEGDMRGVVSVFDKEAGRTLETTIYPDIAQARKAWESSVAPEERAATKPAATFDEFNARYQKAKADGNEAALEELRKENADWAEVADVQPTPEEQVASLRSDISMWQGVIDKGVDPVSGKKALTAKQKAGLMRKIALAREELAKLGVEEPVAETPAPARDIAADEARLTDLSTRLTNARAAKDANVKEIERVYNDVVAELRDAHGNEWVNERIAKAYAAAHPDEVARMVDTVEPPVEPEVPKPPKTKAKPVAPAARVSVPENATLREMEAIPHVQELNNYLSNTEEWRQISHILELRNRHRRSNGEQELYPSPLELMERARIGGDLFGSVSGLSKGDISRGGALVRKLSRMIGVDMKGDVFPARQVAERGYGIPEKKGAPNATETRQVAKGRQPERSRTDGGVQGEGQDRVVAPVVEESRTEAGGGGSTVEGGKKAVVPRVFREMTDAQLRNSTSPLAKQELARREAEAKFSTLSPEKQEEAAAVIERIKSRAGRQRGAVGELKDGEGAVDVLDDYITLGKFYLEELKNKGTAAFETWVEAMREHLEKVTENFDDTMRTVWNKITGEDAPRAKKPLVKEEGKEQSQFAESIYDATESVDLANAIADRNVSYREITNAETLAAAEERVKQHEESGKSLEGLWSEIKSQETWSPEDAVVGGLIVEKLDRRGSSGDYDAAATIVADISERQTKAGQVIQALNIIIKRMSPQLMVAYASKVTARAARGKDYEKSVERAKVVSEEAQQRVKQAVKEAINEMEREAESVANEGAPLSPEELLARAINRYIGPEKPKVGSPEKAAVSRMVRELLAVAQQVLPPKQRLRGNEIERLQEIVRNRQQYAEVWSKAQEIVKKANAGKDAELASLEAYLQRNPDPVFTDARANALIKMALKEKGISVRDIISRYYEKGDAYTREIIDLLNEKAGFKEGDAEYLAKHIRTRLNELIARRKAETIEQMLRKHGVTVSERAIPKGISDLELLSNIGSFDDMRMDVSSTVMERLPKAIASALRDYLKQNDLTMGDLVRRGMSAVDAERTAFIDDLAAKLNVEPRHVAQIRDVAARVYREMINERRLTELNKMSPKERSAAVRKTYVQKLLEADVLGGFEEPALREKAITMVQGLLDVPSITPGELGLIGNMMRVRNLLRETGGQVSPDTIMDFGAQMRDLLSQTDFYTKKERDGFVKEYDKYVLHAPDNQQWTRFNEVVQYITEEHIPAKVMEFLAEKQPVTSTLRMTALQRMFLLSSPKTAIRNVLGNMFNLGFYAARDVGALGIDLLFSTFIKGWKSRSSLPNIRAFARGVGEGYRQVRWDQTLGAKTTFVAGDRYEVPTSRKIFNETGSKLSVAKGRALNWWHNTVTDVLALGDTPMYRGHYEAKLKSYAQDMKRDVKDPSVKAAAEDFALRMTFQDMSTITKSFMGLRHVMNLYGKFGPGNIVLPFAKTPANVLARSLDMTVIAPVVRVVQEVRNYRGAKKAGATPEVLREMQYKITEELGNTLTGAGLIAAGIYLAHKGLLTATDKRDRVRRFQRERGLSDYSLLWQLPWSDKLYAVSYNWAQPSAIPIAVGANFYYNFKRKSGSAGGKFLESLYDSMIAGGDTMWDTTLFSNLSTLMRGDSPTKNIIETFVRSSSQVTPQVLASFARVIDPVMRETDGNALKIIMSRVPGMTFLLPERVNTEGQRAMYDKGGVASRIWSQLFSPAIVNEVVKNDDVRNETLRVFRATDELDVLPIGQPDNLVYERKEYKVTPQDKAVWGAAFAESWRQQVEEFISRDTVYAEQDDEKKAEDLARAVAEARRAAREFVILTMMADGRIKTGKAASESDDEE